MSRPLRHALLIEYFRNYLTGKISFKARIRLRATLTNKDIARRLAERRIGYSYEIILAILDLGDKEKIEALANGYAIKDGAFHAMPSITGRFDVPERLFQAKEHKIGVVVKPTPVLRKTMKECEVKVAGRAVVGPVIDVVNNVFEKSINKTLTAGAALWLRGERLKLTGDSPDVGVHFVSADNPGNRISVGKDEMVVNTPSRLLLQVPELADDKYFVEVTTQYTNGRTPVKTPRTYRFQRPLDVLPKQGN
jgi:hypothetical protein